MQIISTPKSKDTLHSNNKTSLNPLGYLTKITVVIACVALFAGCAPTIDASTDKTMQASMMKIKEDLSAKDKKNFNSAIQTILGDILVDYAKEIEKKGIGVLMGSGDIGAPDQPFRDAVHGKTAAEIIVLADSIKEKKKSQMAKKVAQSPQNACKMLKDDLANLAIAEEAYYADNARYARQKSQLSGLHQSIGVTIAIVQGNQKSFVAIAKHPKCRSIYGWNSSQGGLQEVPNPPEEWWGNENAVDNTGYNRPIVAKSDSTIRQVIKEELDYMRAH